MTARPLALDSWPEDCIMPLVCAGNATYRLSNAATPLRATVSPLELPAGLPWERDEGYDAHTHWRRDRNAMLSEYGANAFKSLARSHPAVFARHHADLRVLDDGRVVRAGDECVERMHA